MTPYITDLLNQSVAAFVIGIIVLGGMTILLIRLARRKGYIEPVAWVFFAMDVYAFLPVDYLNLLKIILLLFGLIMAFAGYKFGLIIPLPSLQKGKKFYQSPVKILLLLLVLGLPGYAVFQAVWTQVHPTCEWEGCDEERSAESEHYCESHRFLDDDEYGSWSDYSKDTTEKVKSKVHTGNKSKSVRTCACSGCDRECIARGNYCAKHTCAKEGCFRQNYQGNFCKEHRPDSYSRPKKKDIEDYEVEDYYQDNKSDFESRDEAYEDFEDNEGEWDYYE